MNLEHLNLDLYDIPEDATTQVSVYLIATDLKTRKLDNALASIGCDSCFCVSELCDLVLAIVGFNDRPDDLYEFYFNLIDKYCKKVNHENSLPIKEAYNIYKILRGEKEKRFIAVG